MQKIVTDITPTMSQAPAKKRVAAYARVSSGKDAMLHSLAAQIDYYSNFIRQNLEWNFVEVYADEALTGTKDNRAEFKRLLDDCRKGLIDMVITKSISRFARNTVLMLNTVRELKLLGVDVYFEEQNIHSVSGDGELMLTILASFAQEESLSCSENCKWRIRNNFKDGIPNNLRIYGYDFADKQLVVNPAEAEVVRMIYTDYLNGMGKNAIMRNLIALGVPTKNGGRWSEGAIYVILRNEKYTGNMLLQKTFSENHLTKAKRINKGKLPMYYTKGTHEAIIEQSVFDEVQTEIARRAQKFSTAPKTPSYSEFTGKIHCGICGANFRRKTTTYNVAWCCATFNKKGRAFCSSKQIPENILKKTAVGVLGLAEYDASVFKAKIEEIRVPENGILLFVFTDGREVLRTWENKPRSEGWTAEMRKEAQKRTLERKAQ
ncbi:recombinase family protein [Caproicibacterium amylolyticum]|uniref:Recombinase family protein n=1 Tax=Caproicibacterium amylolyticum TaxID=2766537 RepID=A0A7G9WGR0_9FIRM|nr:recombinase family protein [Caproicibacterium amylolyticum]QNO17872.1 recombinase family protein [Caproicibacterium amylolyticum]